jgi:hypothetical protein
MSDLIATRRGYLLLFGVVLALVAGALLLPRLIAAERQRQSERPASRADFREAGPGAVVEVAFEIDAPSTSNVLAGPLLEEQSIGTFERTSQPVRVQVTANTPIILGTPADLHPGAIVQVRGTLNGDGTHLIVAQRIVVLTGYVTVQESNGLPASQ